MALDFEARAVVLLSNFLVTLQTKVALHDMLWLPASCPEAAIL